jgi:RNA polymerase sigma-70 factor, ECF subfamily
VRRAAPDPADEPGAGHLPARGDARHGTGRSRGATGTDTPPEPLIDARANGSTPTAPFYPAQRRREDTWPPPSAPPSPEPPSEVANGTVRPARRGRPTPPLGVPRPDHAGPAGHPAAPAPPAPRNGTGPLPPVPPAPPEATGATGAAAPTAAVPLQPPGDPTATQAVTGGLPEDATETRDDDELDEDLADELPDDDGSRAEGWVLVRAAQDGDTEAFGRLFDRYHDTVFRFILFRLSDRPAAEDLTQETFVRAFRRITSVSYQGRDIGAWFVTIARNLVLDHVKSSRYRLESSTAEVADVAPSSFRPGPESEVIAGATHAELLRCVARLGDDQQECIALRFLQGLSVAETAEIMGRNEGAVKALQHRAVRRLAQLLPEGLR